ncbi:MAG: sucrose-phosphate phosphatase, partial [Cyanobacteria bacterium J06636_27]
MARFLFVTDLDNTFVGDDDALRELEQLLSKHRQEHGTKIVYATGRSPVLYQELKKERNLMEPDALVLSVGTEIYLDKSDTPDTAWSEKLSQGWNREVVLSKTADFSELKPQPDTEQGQFKVSFFLEQSASERVLAKLKSAFTESGLDVKLIYSSGIDLDIVPTNSDKGQAMQFLRGEIALPDL